MLTSLYYYNLYKPYIVGSRENSTPRRARITEKNRVSESEKVVILNKSMKNEIINYAQNVSNGVNRFKSAVHTLVRDMNGYARLPSGEQRDKSLQRVEDDLDNIAKLYNRSVEFMREQQHSPRLRTYSYELDDTFRHHRDTLESLGLKFEESESGEQMNFDSSVIRNMPGEEVKWVITANLPIFTYLRHMTSDMLTEPLSEHMNFKGLKYHYNYKMGTMDEDGFGIIESGMLLDIVL